ncbi:hypothetical protein IAU59_000874 [Kwoniella sp. CBS 9459]
MDPDEEEEKINKVHAYHRQGDIALRSTDGVVLMADSWRLANASPVFEGMFEIPVPPTPLYAPTNPPRQPPSTISRPRWNTGPTSHSHSAVLRQRSGHQTVDLDYTTLVLEYFLNLINVSRPSIPPCNFHNSLELLDLCFKFDVEPHIQSVVHDRLLTQCDGRQWELLIWASRRSNVNMAKEALKRMSKRAFMSYGKLRYLDPDLGISSRVIDRELPWHALNKLQPIWEVEILRLVLKPVERGNEDSQGTDFRSFGITHDWTLVAKEFNPMS